MHAPRENSLRSSRKPSLRIARFSGSIANEHGLPDARAPAEPSIRMLTPDGSPITNGRGARRAPTFPGLAVGPDDAAMTAKPMPKTLAAERQAHGVQADGAREPNAKADVSQQPVPRAAEADSEPSSDRHATDRHATDGHGPLFLPQSTKDAFAVRAAKRSVTLLSDAIVLTIAAPFLAIWWIARTVRRRLR